MKLLNELNGFGNPVKHVKRPIDLDDSFFIKKIGYDANGNWSYWVSYDGGKFKKIQHINLGGVTKIDDLRNLEHHSATINAIKNYVLN